jgi:hypothetical protein
MTVLPIERSNATIPSICTLPHDCLHTVFQYLNWQDIHKVSKVSRAMKALTFDAVKLDLQEQIAIFIDRLISSLKPCSHQTNQLLLVRKSLQIQSPQSLFGLKLHALLKKQKITDILCTLDEATIYKLSKIRYPLFFEDIFRIPKIWKRVISAMSNQNSGLLANLCNTLIRAKSIDRAMLVANSILDVQYKRHALFQVSRELIEREDVSQLIKYIKDSIPEEEERRLIITHSSGEWLVRGKIQKAIQLVNLIRTPGQRRDLLAQLFTSLIQTNKIDQALLFINSVQVNDQFSILILMTIFLNEQGDIDQARKIIYLYLNKEERELLLIQISQMLGFDSILAPLRSCLTGLNLTNS